MCKRMIYLISLVVVLSMASDASADLAAHWPFDEGSGSVAHDASGNGHDGSFEGSPQWTSPGWNGIGWCLQFGGDNDRVTVESFDLTGSGITLAAWINVTIFQDDARLISKSEGSGTPDHYWAMILSGSGENNLEFRLRTDTGGTSRYSAPDTHDLQTDEWTHIALTWDASDQFMRFYKNGEEIFSQSKAGGAVGTNPDIKIAIGNQSASVADAAGRIRPFGGLIDDVVVYDRALDKEELEAVMSGLKGIPYARKPDPANGSMLTSTWVNLTWVPGQWAVSHDVYIGTDFDDVDEGAEGMFVGNTANDFIVVGFPGFPYPDGLVPGTTYYWRIDEV
ncbi:MAG: LamG domain-containing protein, partial [Anaerolineales bacterium]